MWFLGFVVGLDVYIFHSFQSVLRQIRWMHFETHKPITEVCWSKLCNFFITFLQQFKISFISNLIIVQSQIRKYGWEKILKLIIIRRTIIWSPRVLGYSQLMSILTLTETGPKKMADFYRFVWSNEDLADVAEICSQRASSKWICFTSERWMK